jgi:NADH:ubiquinone oxidoreductase subunit 4 (subunit M)
VALVLVLGLYPKLVTDKITPSTDEVIAIVENGSSYQAPEPVVIAVPEEGSHDG